MLSRKSGDPSSHKVETGVSAETTQGTLGVIYIFTPIGKSDSVAASFYMEWQKFHRLCFDKMICQHSPT